MNNKKMYVITLSTGSYDDHNDVVIAVTDDFAKGSAYVQKMNSIYQSAKEKMDAFYSKHQQEWMKENPRPNMKDHTPIAVPKWKGDEKITQEMRDERKRIQEENDKLSREAVSPLREWAKQSLQFQNDWINANLTQEEQEVQKNMNENRWEIEEVPWLE